MKRMTATGARAAPRLALAGLALGLMLLAPGGVRAANVSYKMQPILKIGDTVNGFVITRDYGFWVQALSDSGQLALFVSSLADGSGPLLQWADGQFTTVAGPGVEAPGVPGGKFPPDGIIGAPSGMNQRGNIVFSAHGGPATHSKHLGTFLWDSQARMLTAVQLPGMSAVNGLTFRAGTNAEFTTAISNADDIVFQAWTGSAAPGVFFLGRDNQLQPVVLPSQPLPDGRALGATEWLFPVSIVTDAGAAVFYAGDPSRGADVGAYRWDKGSLSPLAIVGAAAPAGGTIRAVAGAWLNNANDSVLLDISLSGFGGPYGLYRFAGGALTPLVVPGQPMPGGGKLKDLLWRVNAGLATAASAADDAGQHVFVAVLNDNTQGLYLLGADGTLSLLLKSGTHTELGTITRFALPLGADSIGVALNNKGQIALPIEFDNGPSTVVLLTPTTP